MGILPGWFYLIFGFLLAVSIIAAFAIFIEECRKKHPRILYILMYATLSFGVIEHAFDGGLFDPRIPILFIFLLTLLYGISKKQVKTISIVFVLSWILAFAYMKLGILSEEDSYNRIILSMVAYVGFFGMPFILLHGKITNQFRWLLFILGIIIIIPFLMNSSSIKDYRKISTASDSSYVALYPSDKNIPFTEIDYFGLLSIYEIPAGTFKDIEAILSHYTLMDNISPVSVFWNTCFPKGEPYIYTFTLTTYEPLMSLQKETPLSATYLAPQNPSRKNGFYRYDAVMKLEACTPRQANILEETIKELGAHTFFITKIQNVRSTASALGR